MASKRNLFVGLAASAVTIFLVSFAAFWLSLLLSDGHAHIPNYEERMAMFKSLMRRPRPGSNWIPRQGENWIL